MFGGKILHPVSASDYFLLVLRDFFPENWLKNKLRGGSDKPAFVKPKASPAFFKNLL